MASASTSAWEILPLDTRSHRALSSAASRLICAFFSSSLALAAGLRDDVVFELTGEGLEDGGIPKDVAEEVQGGASDEVAWSLVAEFTSRIELFLARPSQNLLS